MRTLLPLLAFIAFGSAPVWTAELETKPPGEQFALPEAAEQLRHPPEDQQPIEISGADPLNFHGILIPDERVPALTTRKIKVV